MRRLVLVRHAESVWNAEGRIQGQQCAGLSGRGEQQAQRVGESLAAIHPGARVQVSDLLRCQQTAAPLLEALGADPVPNPALRERHFGCWEGLSRDEVAERDGARWQRFLAGDDSVLAEVGGETDELFLARVEPELRALLASTPVDGVTIAVTHGGPVWHGTHAVMGFDRDTLGGVHNASVTELLAVADGRLVLDRWNELGHLPAAMRLGHRAAVRA